MVDGRVLVAPPATTDLVLTPGQAGIRPLEIAQARIARDLEHAAEVQRACMPSAAPAALASIFRMKGLSPRMSATENIMVMSLMPTNGDVSPDATVETITFGKP